MTVADRDTQNRCLSVLYGAVYRPGENRKGSIRRVDNLRVTVDSEGMSASSPEHYTGVTDVNGQHLTLKHDSGMVVENAYPHRDAGRRRRQTSSCP